ncbi:MAG: hypothetical protein PWQ20_1673 [Thermotogaceae bacterium]|jgi:hypothetical protein|nr:hypothetical protein [Thermotogaceae bacterium]
MPLRREATLEEKLAQVKELIENPDSLSAMSEGSKVIIMIVKPKEESEVIDELKKIYSEKFSSVNCAEQMIKTANNYGYEQLREDLEFFGDSLLADFSQKIRDRIVDEILRTCEMMNSEIVVLHRVGILNGITRLNPIIEAVAGRLKKPLLIIYPGKRNGNTLTFLNSRHDMSVYRAIII